MYCSNCGTQLKEGTLFCPNCGAGAGISQPGSVPAQDPQPVRQKPSPNIELCPDGVYRWVYEVNMFKNPTILITILKVLGISIGVTYLLILLIGLISEAMDGLESFLAVSGGFLLVALALLVIGLISYGIVAAIYGGKYVVLFEMTDTYVKHIQMPKQFKRAQAIGWLAAMAGLATGNLAMTGLGINTAAQSSTATQFQQVKSVRLLPRRQVIKVSQTLQKNHIYAATEDFPFVANFILAHCPQAKVRQ